MQVHSLISNTISEEILQKGHLSIRFMADGFSLLLEDSSYRPVILMRSTEETPLSVNSYVPSCLDWLDRHTLLDQFLGEISVVVDESPSTLVPSDLYSNKEKESYLAPVAKILPNDSVKSRKIENRAFRVVYAIPGAVSEMIEKVTGKVRVIPAMEVLLSMSDQVNAADHQRGFALVELQHGFLGILYIRDDKVIISNHMQIKHPDEIVYHVLNTLEKVGFDRRNMPMFHAGASFDEELKTLKKYIRNINPLPYHIFDVDKSAVTEHIILAEATRCA